MRSWFVVGLLLIVNFALWSISSSSSLSSPLISLEKNKLLLKHVEPVHAPKSSVGWVFLVIESLNWTRVSTEDSTLAPQKDIANPPKNVTWSSESSHSPSSFLIFERSFAKCCEIRQGQRVCEASAMPASLPSKVLVIDGIAKLEMIMHNAYLEGRSFSCSAKAALIEDGPMSKKPVTSTADENNNNSAFADDATMTGASSAQEPSTLELNSTVFQTVRFSFSFSLYTQILWRERRSANSSTCTIDEIYVATTATCVPVACTIKYWGSKNFFNSITGLCEPYILCPAAYPILNYTTNTCQSANVAVPNITLSSLSSPYTQVSSTVTQSGPCNCNNGLRVANISGCFCSCLDGWVSTPPTTDPNNFTWCNRSSGTLYTPTSMGSGTITQSGTIIIVTICITCICCTGCCCYCCRRQLGCCFRCIRRTLHRNQDGIKIVNNGPSSALKLPAAKESHPKEQPKSYKLQHSSHSPAVLARLPFRNDNAASSWLADLPAECPPCIVTYSQGLFLWMMEGCDVAERVGDSEINLESSFITTSEI